MSRTVTLLHARAAAVPSLARRGLLVGFVLEVLLTSSSVLHYRHSTPGDYAIERTAQLRATFLAPEGAGVPGRLETLAFQALAAENAGRSADALALWMEEWTRRPSNRHAAFRIVDLSLRLEPLEKTAAQVERLRVRWPSSPYVRHLALRLPDVRRFLDHPVPLAARAGRNPEDARFVRDGRLGTAWSTARRQRAGDWLELDVDVVWRVRGVVLLSAPEFGAGPSALDVVGTTPSGVTVALATLTALEAGEKGWVALRFGPVRLKTLRCVVRGEGKGPWIVSEARVLTASPETDR